MKIDQNHITFHPNFAKAVQQCPFWNKLNKEQQFEYLQSAPFKTNKIYFWLLLGLLFLIMLIISAIIIVSYNSNMNQRIIQYNNWFFNKYFSTNSTNNSQQN